MSSDRLSFGIRANLSQFSIQLLQVFLVGLTIGMMRNVVPAVASEEFGLQQNSFTLLASFVVAFGFIKGTMNFFAGGLSERLGRKKVLLLGWFFALPIPYLVLYAENWYWIVAATAFLGINQGLAWSMTLTSKLDLTRPTQKGLVNGLNEFSGYFAVAVAGVVTAYLATSLGTRVGLFWFGISTIVLAIFLVFFTVRETLPWVKEESERLDGREANKNSIKPISTFEVFRRVSWEDKRMFAFSQAGLVEKFVDAIVWIFYPLFLLQQGLDLKQAGWVIGIYGTVWGASQLLTGPLSDRVGRRIPIVAGMYLSGMGVIMMLWGEGILWWSFSSALAGFGMALLYPNLGAAVADIAHPSWRSSALGVYRFWRDLGYGIGALGLGITAQSTGYIEYAFWFVAVAMFVSGFVVMLLGCETHPLLQKEKRVLQ
ncbi:MAG: MFS transporter [Gammaproteobacteria bacterium]|nr:MFS transporter [Gammaproteobacteria bacterium]